VSCANRWQCKKRRIPPSISTRIITRCGVVQIRVHLLASTAPLLAVLSATSACTAHELFAAACCIARSSSTTTTTHLPSLRQVSAVPRRETLEMIGYGLSAHDRASSVPAVGNSTVCRCHLKMALMPLELIDKCIGSRCDEPSFPLSRTPHLSDCMQSVVGLFESEFVHGSHHPSITLRDGGGVHAYAFCGVQMDCIHPTAWSSHTPHQM